MGTSRRAGKIVSEPGPPGLVRTEADSWSENWVLGSETGGRESCQWEFWRIPGRRGGRAPRLSPEVEGSEIQKRRRMPALEPDEGLSCRYPSPDNQRRSSPQSWESKEVSVPLLPSPQLAGAHCSRYCNREKCHPTDPGNVFLLWWFSGVCPGLP